MIPPSQPTSSERARRAPSPRSLAPNSVVDSNGHALRVACGALDALVRASRLGAAPPALAERVRDAFLGPSATAARPFANASEFAGSGVARDGGPTSTGARIEVTPRALLAGRATVSGRSGAATQGPTSLVRSVSGVSELATRIVLEGPSRRRRAERGAAEEGRFILPAFLAGLRAFEVTASADAEAFASFASALARLDGTAEQIRAFADWAYGSGGDGLSFEVTDSFVEALETTSRSAASLVAEVLRGAAPQALGEAQAAIAPEDLAVAAASAALDGEAYDFFAQATTRAFELDGGSLREFRAHLEDEAFWLGAEFNLRVDRPAFGDAAAAKRMADTVLLRLDTAPSTTLFGVIELLCAPKPSETPSFSARLRSSLDRREFGRRLATAAATVANASELTGSGVARDGGRTSTGALDRTLTLAPEQLFFGLLDGGIGAADAPVADRLRLDDVRPLDGYFANGPLERSVPLALHRRARGEVHVWSPEFCLAAVARGPAASLAALLAAIPGPVGTAPLLAMLATRSDLIAEPGRDLRRAVTQACALREDGLAAICAAVWARETPAILRLTYLEFAAALPASRREVLRFRFQEWFEDDRFRRRLAELRRATDTGTPTKGGNKPR